MSQALTEIVRELKSLEPLPEVALRVLDLGARPDVTPGELIVVLETDAGLTAKVLKLTNSALYGFRREIGSLREAGNMIGTQALVNLALTSCTGRYYRNYGAQSSDKARAMWEAALANALASALIARVSGLVDRNRAYTAGLLLDLGSVVLARFCADEAHAIEERVASGSSPIAAERAVLGIDHAEAGARLCERWGFPPALADAVRHHHEPERATIDPYLAFTTHVAGELTEAVRAQQLDVESTLRVEASSLAHAGLDPMKLSELETSLLRELERAREVVAVA